MADSIEGIMYEAVAYRLEETLDEIILPEQVEAAIGRTYGGSLSDYFWSAYDNEVARLTDFFRSVKDEPVVRERMEKA